MDTISKVFFSHKTSDSERVGELQKCLKDALPNFLIVNVAAAVPHSDDWKTIATDILQSCHTFVCIVGDDTHTSEPVDWEIREAYRLKKPILVTTLSTDYEFPPACKDLRIACDPWDATIIAGQISEMLLPRALFPDHDWMDGTPQPAEISQQYDLMVQSWESLITRRQMVNTVYTTANSALLAGVGVMISSVEKVGINWVIAGVAVLTFLGAALSYNWYRTISSYGLLSRAKAKVVIALETYMPAQIFDAEWKVLEANKYTSTTVTDRQTALFFFVLFTFVFVISFIATIVRWI